VFHVRVKDMLDSDEQPYKSDCNVLLLYISPHPPQLKFMQNSLKDTEIHQSLHIGTLTDSSLFQGEMKLFDASRLCQSTV